MCVFPKDTDKVIYLHANPEEAAGISEMTGAALVSIDGIDWNYDLTPWPGKTVFRGQPDFGGGAQAHLDRLAKEIIPFAEVQMDRRPSRRMIAGYSLAGMFAVYAAQETELFDGVASVSGSLWYDGFSGYVKSKKPTVGRAYFSVGDREKLGRNRAFRSIEDRTREMEEYFRSNGCRTAFELNPGGHFDDPSGRLAKAVRWLAEEENKG